MLGNNIGLLSMQESLIYIKEGRFVFSLLVYFYDNHIKKWKK